mgnify:FL=1
MTEPPPLPHRRRGLFGSLRANFLTGLVVVLPVGLTIYLIWTVAGWIDGWVLPLIPTALQPDALIRDLFGPDTRIGIRGAGVVIFLVATVVIGWFAKGIIGRALLRPAERLVDRTPVVRSIYSGLKQLAESVFAQNGSQFERACLVRFPHHDLWAIGFITGRARGEIAQKLPSDSDLLGVFVATGLVPPAGFLVYVPEREVVMLEMRIEDAAKLIISAGLVYPNPKDPTQPLIAA